MPHPNQSATPKVKDTKRPLDITRPFMDDIGAFDGGAPPPAGYEIWLAVVAVGGGGGEDAAGRPLTPLFPWCW